ncbi:MAG: hypothetical protein RL095_3433 [Verrucomicrobiota bacterium]
MLDARQRQEGWGAAVIPRLARDLKNDLPEEKGFSERNIKQMMAFHREYRDLEFVLHKFRVLRKVRPAFPQSFCCVYLGGITAS